MKLISVIVLVSVFGLMITSPVEDQENGVVDSNPSFREYLSQSETEKSEIHAEKRDGKKNKPTKAAHTHSHSSHSDESSEEVRSTRPKRDAKKNKPTQAAHTHNHDSHAAHSHESSEEVHPTTVKA